MTTLEPEDYTQYSDKDLQGLKEIHETTLAHYDEMLKRELKNGDRFAVELSRKYLDEYYQALLKEIQRRKDK